MDDSAPRIVGDFKIKRELGRGGMGVVYLARQLSLGRDVALKMLLTESVDPERILRFQREAALLGRLSHPNIVQVHTVGEERPWHYLAMEFVDGTTLDAVLRARTAGCDDELPRAFQADFARAATIAVREVALGLGAAHQAGIVHRDVKPSNILIEKDGRARLADFGLARDLAAAALTHSQTAVGTPYYMSPERFAAGEPTPAADVYACGAVLYECLTGRRPFEQSTAEALMASIVSDDVRPPRALVPSIPRDLQTIVLKCLEKEPERRYADGDALAADLLRFLKDEPIAASATSALTQAIRRMRRRRTSALALVLVLVVAAAFLAWGWFERRAKQEQRMREAYFDALDHDDLDSALAKAGELLDARPSLASMRFERAELLLRMRRWNDAAADYERLVDDGDGDGDAAALGLKLCRALAAGTEVKPEIPAGVGSETAREVWYRGLMHQARGELVQARDEAQRATEIDPGLTEAWYTLGSVRLRLEDYEGARAAYSTYERRRGRLDVLLKLGAIERDFENFDAALAHFERYKTARPNDVLGWINLAACQLGLAAAYDDNKWTDQADEHRAKARECLDRSRAIDPDYFVVDYTEALWQVQSGNFDAAAESFEKAIAAGASDPSWGLQMCVNYARQLDWSKRADLAIDCLDDAVARRPEFRRERRWVYAYADSLALADQPTEAIAVLDAALEGPLAGCEQLAELRENIAKRKQ